MTTTLDACKDIAVEALMRMDPLRRHLAIKYCMIERAKVKTHIMPDGLEEEIAEVERILLENVNDHGS